MVIAKAKKWGNSMGIIIPMDVVNRLNIHEGEELDIEMTKKSNPLNELMEFGKRHKFKKSTEEIIKELRKNESKYL